jgi:hypothetical protein
MLSSPYYCSYSFKTNSSITRMSQCTLWILSLSNIFVQTERCTIVKFCRLFQMVFHIVILCPRQWTWHCEQFPLSWTDPVCWGSDYPTVYQNVSKAPQPEVGYALLPFGARGGPCQYQTSSPNQNHEIYDWSPFVSYLRWFFIKSCCGKMNNHP